MTPHDHREFVLGCYRCELGLDEVRNVEAEGLRAAVSIEAAANALGLPLSELDSLTRIPAVSSAMLAVRYGIRPELAAARYDLPWLDDGPMSGVDWERLLDA